MSLTWSNENVLRLIQLYRKEQLLWDTSNTDYKNKTKKNDAWENIAKVLNMPRKEVESKVHTLRSQFLRERKRTFTSKTSGSGKDDVIISTWFAYQPMTFLLKETTNSGGMNTMDTEGKTYNITETSQQESPSDLRYDIEKMTQQHSLEEYVDLTSSQSSDHIKSSENIRKRIKDSGQNKGTEKRTKRRIITEPNYLEMALAKLDKMSQLETKEDSFDHFGKCIASLLRDLPFNTALTMQIEMLTLFSKKHNDKATDNFI